MCPVSSETLEIPCNQADFMRFENSTTSSGQSDYFTIAEQLCEPMMNNLS